MRDHYVGAMRGVALGICPDVTLADICLVPQVANARRFKVPLDRFPNIVAADAACAKLAPFDAIRWVDQSPEIHVGGKWYRWLAIDDVEVPTLIDFVSRTYKPDEVWRIGEQGGRGEEKQGDHARECVVRTGPDPARGVPPAPQPRT